MSRILNKAEIGLIELIKAVESSFDESGAEIVAQLRHVLKKLR